jgi:glucose/mannose-6-phosphate isomerase
VTEQAPLDTLGMWEAAASLPEQLSGALRTAGDALGTGALSPPGGGVFRAVAAFGLGTGGMAAAAAAALCAPDLAVPFWRGEGTAVPAFVGADTLVFAVSSSGGTAETLDAAAEALDLGATVVAVGGGPGEALARLDGGAGFHWCPVHVNGAGDGGESRSTARVALGAATVPLLVAMARAGLRPDCTAAVQAASDALARRRDALVAPGRAAADLARRLGRTIPLVYGSAGVAAVAADWWKAQVNLNAKAPAFAATLPGLTHDELAGWGQGGDVTRQTMSLVLLRHAGEGPRASSLFAAVRAATDEVMADIFEVQGEGEDDLTRLFDLVLVGQLVSLHLAAREGVDPGPVPAVDEAQAAGSFS